MHPLLGPGSRRGGGRGSLEPRQGEIEATYNLYTYWPERKHALSLWRSSPYRSPTTTTTSIDPTFIATLPADSPLFVGENNPKLGSRFEKSKLLRQLWLVMENADGFEDLDHKFVLRAVPHLLGLSRYLKAGNQPTPPLQRTGWGGDGAPGSGTLREFAGGRFFHPDGKARFAVTEWRDSGDPVAPDFPVYLTTGRVVSQYLSGTQTRRIGPLVDQFPHPEA